MIWIVCDVIMQYEIYEVQTSFQLPINIVLCILAWHCLWFWGLAMSYRKLNIEAAPFRALRLLSNQLPHLCDQLNTTRPLSREKFNIYQKSSINMKSRVLIMKILLGAIVVSSAAQPVAAFKLPMKVTPSCPRLFRN